MNAKRRKEIKKIMERVDQITLSLRQILEEIETISEEEQEAYDNLPDSFQEGEKGEQMQSCIDTLDSFRSDIDNAIFDIENACNEVNENIINN